MKKIWVQPTTKVLDVITSLNSKLVETLCWPFHNRTDHTCLILMHLHVHWELSSLNSRTKTIWMSGIQSAAAAIRLIREEKLFFIWKTAPCCGMGFFIQSSIHNKNMIYGPNGLQHPQVYAYRQWFEKKLFEMMTTFQPAQLWELQSFMTGPPRAQRLLKTATLVEYSRLWATSCFRMYISVLFCQFRAGSKEEGKLNSSSLKIHSRL